MMFQLRHTRMFVIQEDQGLYTVPGPVISVFIHFVIVVFLSVCSKCLVSAFSAKMDVWPPSRLAQDLGSPGRLAFVTPAVIKLIAHAKPDYQSWGFYRKRWRVQVDPDERIKGNY